MNLEALVLSFSDRKKLVNFLLKRTNCKALLLKVLKNIIDDCEAVQILADIFDLLNEVLSSVQRFKIIIKFSLSNFFFH